MIDNDSLKQPSPLRSVPSITTNGTVSAWDETFTPGQVRTAIITFLEWGEQTQGGYFSGNGWAARCLRYHLTQLEQVGT